MFKDKIKNLAVRIFGENIKNTAENKVGSGVICFRKDSENVYVLTCWHTIENTDKVIIEYQKNRKICIKTKAIKILKKDDIVAICIEKSKFDEMYLKNLHEVYYKNIDQLKLYDELFLCGFSGKHQNITEFEGTKHIFELKFSSKTDISSKFMMSNENTEYGNDDYKGFSGGGVFFQKNERLYLVGLCSNGFGGNADYGKLYAVRITALEKFMDNNQNLLKIIFDDDLNLEKKLNELDKIDNAVFECSEIQALKNKLILSMEFIENFDSDFCMAIENCKYIECPYKCEIYLQNLITFITLLANYDSGIKLVENEGDKFKSLTYSIEKPRKNIKFICTDGTDSKKIQTSEMIRQIKTNEVMQDEILDNTLIVWNSDDNVRLSKNKYIDNNTFRNILSNISDPSLYEYYSNVPTVGFDIANPLQSKDISIVHTKYFEEEAQELFDANKLTRGELKNLIANIIE